MERVLLRVVVPSLIVVHLLLHIGFGLGLKAPDLIAVALLLAAREVGMGRRGRATGRLLSGGHRGLATAGRRTEGAESVGG